MASDTVDRVRPHDEGGAVRSLPDSAKNSARSNLLYRNGAALVLSTGLSSLLGAGYWVVAARSAPPAAVGQATALVAALTALSTLGQLNLGAALATFLPRAGYHRSGLARASYGASTVASLLLGAAFAVVAPRVDSSFSFLATVPAAIGFSLSVAGWSLFALQDAVLVGTRRATWVPLENVAYNAAKFAMLIIAGGATVTAIFAAWVIPAALAVIPISIALFWKVLPTREEPADDSDPRSFRRFLAGETTAMVFDQLGVTLLPVLVVVLLGPVEGAAFGIAWMMVLSLDQLVISMGVSLIVEGAQPGADVRSMHRHLLRRALIGLGGLVALAEVGAPLVLRVFGTEYQDAATTVFRLLLIGSIGRAVTVLAICAARAERRIGWIVRVHLWLAVAVPTGAVLLGTSIGLDGVGLAWAVANNLVAVGVAVTYGAQAHGRHRPGRRVAAAAGAAGQESVPGPSGGTFEDDATVELRRDLVLERLAALGSFGHDTTLTIRRDLVLQRLAAQGSLGHGTTSTTHRNMIPSGSTTGELPPADEPTLTIHRGRTPGRRRAPSPPGPYR